MVFPEVWVSGYPFWSEGWDSQIPAWIDARMRFREAALVIPSDDTDRLSQAAREANIYVALGCNELDPRPEVETIYNTLLFIGRDGKLLRRHRKLHPTFVERLFWGQGDGSDIFVLDPDIGRIGGLICGENLMTLARAAMIAQGEHIHIAVFPGAFALLPVRVCRRPIRKACSGDMRQRGPTPSRRVLSLCVLVASTRRRMCRLTSLTRAA